MKRVIWLLTEFRDLCLWPLVVMFPRNQKKVLVGAWSGRNFGCNPKYFFKYLLENSEYECIWVGQDHLKDAVLSVPHAKFVRQGSLAAFYHYLTARYFVCNINWRSDIIDLPIFRRAKLINPFHGLPFKKIGEHQYAYLPVEAGGSRLRKWVRRQLRRWDAYCYPQESWLSVSSEHVGDLYASAFPGRFSRKRCVIAGQPRNDFLINHKADIAFCAALKDCLAKKLGVPADKRWFLYLPTFRYDTDQVYSFVTSKRAAEFSHLLDAVNAIIIEKQHPRVLQRLHVPTEHVGNVYSISEGQGCLLDIQELLLVSDRLITDYSSCFFDFSLMDRPCVHFAYDWETYRDKDTGVYYDLRDVAGGPVCSSEEELVGVLLSSDTELMAQRGHRLKTLTVGERGLASQILWNAARG